MPWVKHHQLLLLSALFALVVLVIARAAGRWDMAVYALSFWHYLVYALAFFWRRVSVDIFKRDAVLLKGLSLAALAAVLLTGLPNPLAVVVMAAGFGLNIAAARALGTDRTYFGYELAKLPPKRVTSFPYSLVPHPMLVGNIVGFAAPLLDADFRSAWWPLAVIHVLLNAATILQEMQGRESRLLGALWGIGGLALGCLLFYVHFVDLSRLTPLVVLACVVFGTVIIRRYARRSV